jgi:TatA/E family protein of Tat protein translocase
MGTVSPIHWIIVAVVLLALFGPKTLAKVGKTAGRGVRAVSDVKKDLSNVPNQILADVTRPTPKREPPS